MRAALAQLLIIIALLSGGAAVAERRPMVVVEFFTSQGCPGCMPAYEFIDELVENEDVLPLTLHVDYWDYLGWTDTFARPEHTVRQKSYSYGFGNRSVYTPQMVIGGVEQLVGSHVFEAMEILKRHQGAKHMVMMDTLKADDGTKRLRIESVSDLGLPDEIFVQLVRFIPEAMVVVKHGENAGSSITSTNIVTGIHDVGSWNGQGIVEFDLPQPLAPKDQAAAIILQAATEEGHLGQILSAIRLD